MGDLQVVPKLRLKGYSTMFMPNADMLLILSLAALMLCKYHFSLCTTIRLLLLTFSNHIYMGFTMCGQYFLSYTEKMFEDLGPFNFNASYEYELYLWRFVPGEKLKFISKHKIFKHLKGLDVLDKIKFMQSPKDYYKLICYGLT